MTISFEDYCEDYLDLHIALMSREQLETAREGYQQIIKANEKNTPEHKAALAKAKASRQLAKFYGGKALTGSAKQKAWAEDIRQKFLESNDLTDEEKEELITCGGFTNGAKFWIENRNVPAAKMTARNIVAQYRALKELEEKHFNTLARTGSAASKNAARKEIQDYIDNCDFKF